MLWAFANRGRAQAVLRAKQQQRWHCMCYVPSKRHHLVSVPAQRLTRLRVASQHGRSGGMFSNTTLCKASQLLSAPLVQACLIAQLLSLLLCVCGITSGVLAGKGINAPTTQSLLNYLLLVVVCGWVHMRANGWRWRFSNSWHVYALLAFLDVEGNFLVTKAYQYTSITSVTLLDCFTIPAVMALSWFVLRSRYNWGHAAGAGLCVVGLIMLVATDASSSTGGSNPYLGDALVLMGACVYAICNVAQEKLLVETTRWELLACVGAWGTLFAGAQALLLERDAWGGALWDASAIGSLIGFAGALFSFYLLVPSVLIQGGAAVLNVSLLTSDLWAAGARAALFGGFGGTGTFFAIALLAEAAGIVLYAWSGEAKGQVPPGGAGGTGWGWEAVRGDGLWDSPRSDGPTTGGGVRFGRPDPAMGSVNSARQAEEGFGRSTGHTWHQQQRDSTEIRDISIHGINRSTSPLLGGGGGYLRQLDSDRGHTDVTPGHINTHRESVTREEVEDEKRALLLPSGGPSSSSAPSANNSASQQPFKVVLPPDTPTSSGAGSSSQQPFRSILQGSYDDGQEDSGAAGSGQEGRSQ